MLHVGLWGDFFRRRAMRRAFSSNVSGMSRCLITGATGFVGSHLARRLARDREVRCLVRATSRTQALEDLGVELAPGSLDDPDSLATAVADVDVVFHVAGRIAAHRAADFLRDNVEGTRNLAAACAAREQPPVLVIVSSLAAGGPGTLDAPRTEDDQPRPVSAYGRSKLAAEHAAVDVADAVPMSIVRPPMVFGQGDRASLQILRGMKFLPMHPMPGLRKFPLSLVHVTDLCNALVRVADDGERVPAANIADESPGAGRYYVSAERALSYADFGRLAAAAAGWAVVPVPVPRRMFWVLGSVGEVVGRIRRRPSILNLDKVRETMQKGWVCSDEKIRNELGFKPGAPLERRLAETITWYRAHGWL